IFVNDVKNQHSVHITSIMTAIEVVGAMREGGQIPDDDPSWTIFELVNDFGAERPLADWELVADVLATWDASQNNALGPIAGFPSFMAPLQMDKDRKWKKRTFYTRDTAVYHAKDKKVPKAPSDFVFAFKSQESIRIFEKPERDYIHFLCADSLIQMREWLLCIRSIKVSHKLASADRCVFNRAC
ncbi:hypothetical protein THASP1DRAFT_14007, partial [Thamnocephalis sphaerospora]